MTEEDDPFGFDQEPNDATAHKPTVEKEDPKDDAEQQADPPKAKSQPRGRSKSKTTAAGGRDYGRSGITTTDPKQMGELTNTLATHIKKLGTYETLTCIANAFERYGQELDNNPNTIGRGRVYLDAATTVDEIVGKLSNGTR